MSPSEKLAEWRKRKQVTEEDVVAIIEAHFEQDPDVSTLILSNEVRNALGYDLRMSIYFVQRVVRDSTNPAIPQRRRESIAAIGRSCK